MAATMTWHRLNEDVWQLWDDILVVGLAQHQGSYWVGQAAGARQHYSLTLVGIQAKVEGDCPKSPALLA